MDKILVIKHGGLGEFIQATGAFSAIREKHKSAHIIFLTKEKYSDLAKKSPYFNEIWIDPMPAIWDIPALLKFSKKLREEKFQRVYDLECSTQSNLYFRIIGRKKPEWSGSIKWCSHPIKNTIGSFVHILDRYDEQLAIAGIESVPMPEISWLLSDVSRFALPEGYVLILPGGRNRKKRWHKEGFAELANWLADFGLLPVFVGDSGDRSIVTSIIKDCANINVLDLTGETSLADAAQLARGAVITIGNDTGLMQLSAAVGCPCLIIYSKHSFLENNIPAGASIFAIKENDLSKLEPERVLGLLEELFEIEENLDTDEKPPKTQHSE